MLRAAAITAVLLATTAAQAQQSIHPKDPEAGVPLYKRKFAPPEGSLDWLPDGARIVATIKPPPPLPGPLPRIPTERVVISYGAGGLIAEHNWRFGGYRQGGVDVEVRGACMSACTLITAYIGKDKLCFAAGAYMGFHAARSYKGEYMAAETDFMYRQQPADIRNWIDSKGGWQNLLLDGFWYLDDRELWAMGYPKCK